MQGLIQSVKQNVGEVAKNVGLQAQTRGILWMDNNHIIVIFYYYLSKFDFQFYEVACVTLQKENTQSVKRLREKSSFLQKRILASTFIFQKFNLSIHFNCFVIYIFIFCLFIYWHLQAFFTYPNISPKYTIYSTYFSLRLCSWSCK